MGRSKKYGNITLKPEDRKKLVKLANSQTSEYRKVQRAKIILLSADGMSNEEIASSIGVHRNTVAAFVTKYIAAGIDYALNDSARSGRPNRICDDEKAWITNIACTKPKDIGYGEELWTYRSLQKHIRKHCMDAGYPGLSQISPNTVRTILESGEIKPNKITYYLERKDPDFESKMHEVLVVYKQVSMCFDEAGNLVIPVDEPKTVTVSYDEKPGIQALQNIAPDLPPTQEHGKVARDYEYKRLGTLSLLAGLDLLTGEIIPLVSDTHKSSDFIEWLLLIACIVPGSPYGYFPGVLSCRLYPAADSIAAYPKVLRTFIPSKLLMCKVILYCILFKLLIKLFTHGKFPPVFVSIIQLFLKPAMFNLYYLYSNTK